MNFIKDLKYFLFYAFIIHFTCSVIDALFIHFVECKSEVHVGQPRMAADGNHCMATINLPA
jgi:hypothetical protein